MTEPTSGAAPEILIVEDSAVEAELLRRSLVRAGYAVSTARNGEDGLQAAHAQRPALVMSDINMPVMNGYQLCRAIKNDDELWSVPLILLTARAEPADIIEAINSGADAYIVKPFAETDLLCRIRSLLDAPIERLQADERRNEMVEYGGRRYVLAASGRQILNLMLSLYENMLNLSRELVAVQTEHSLLNENLDRQVRERTAALRESDEAIRTLFDSVQDGVLLADVKDQRFRMANAAMCRMLGYSRDELLNLRVQDIHREEDMASVAQEFERLAKGETGLARNLPMKRKDGTVFHADVNSGPMIFNAVACLVAVFRDVTERKQAELALQESESKYRLLFEGSRDALLVARPPSWRFTDMNQAALQLFGATSKADFAALGPWDVSPERQPDGHPSSEKGQEIAAMILREGSHLFEWELRRLNGKTFTANVLGTRMEAGGQVFLQATVRDISESKRLEQASTESENRLRTVLESVQAGIVIIDPEVHKIVDVNAFAARMIGAPKESIIGAVCHKFICRSEWGQCPITDLHQTVDSKECVLLTATNESREIIKTVTTVLLGGRSHLLESFIDISERKHQEQALRESEERFKSILENVVEMFFVLDGALRAEYMSPRCLAIYGYSGDEMTARPTLWIKAIHPEDRRAVTRQAVEEARGGARAAHEFRIIRKDGSVRQVRSASNPILGADGKLQRVYGTVMDVTEFESLRSSLKEKEVLLKEIHHRVKNNLQIVISLMRLQSRAFSEERVRAALKDLETRIRAMALVHEHLYHSSDLAKIGFKDYLKGLCEELFRTYRADAGRIALEIDAEAVALDIERAIPCGLIINELLTNAIKYAFPGDRKGVIRIAIRNTPDSGVEIVVSDDGIGMPETLDIRKAKTLGLQLVTTLAENQLKGRFELERAGGTRFRIQFRI